MDIILTDEELAHVINVLKYAAGIINMEGYSRGPETEVETECLRLAHELENKL